MTCIRIDLTFWSRSTLPSLQPIRHKDSTFIDKHSFALNRFAVYNVYNFFLSKTLLPNKVRFGELLCCPSNRFARKSQFYCFFRACNIARYIGTVDRIIEPGFSTWSIQPVELSIKQSILFSKFNDRRQQNVTWISDYIFNSSFLFSRFQSCRRGYCATLDPFVRDRAEKSCLEFKKICGDIFVIKLLHFIQIFNR